MSRKTKTIALHADWLTLLEPDGPFLTASVLRDAFPSGLDRTAPHLRAAAKLGWDDARDEADRHDYVAFVLTELLGWAPRYRTGDDLNPAWSFTPADHDVTVRPSGALVDGEGKPRVLVIEHPAGMRPTMRPNDGSHWTATPVQRLALLCRSVKCELGLLTDGDLFTLVYAPANAPTGHGTWRASLFTSEPAMLDSLVSVLTLRRFFAMADTNTPEALLRRSADNRTEVTNTLGRQARRAVELLVNEISRANLDSNGQLLAGITPHEVYEAAVTVLMRLVICLTAEERRLLPIDEPDSLYVSTYAISTLKAELEEIESISPELLDDSYAAWHRILATSRAIHGGVEIDDMRVKPYGSRLFDPNRYPFLEGRTAADAPLTTDAAIPISDLSVLGIMRALQELALHGELRNLSYKHLDVEQIGHVYESLLDHDAVTATQIVLGFDGRQGDEPELALHDIESSAFDGRDALVEFLRTHTSRATKEINRLLDAEVLDELRRNLLVACDSNTTMRDRLLPYANLLRLDLRGVPFVFPAGAVYVTETGSKRDSGTAYTTRELAEEMAQHTLAPLVYAPGPLETADQHEWRLKSSAEILALKICEPAVGSGAILVAACRYLAERLLEAWINEGVVDDSAATRTAADDPTRVDVLVDAQRAIAERCLYAVDRNPMAVEMAKLSLWLVTLAKDRPFSFLDHAIVCGDTLLGITDIRQLINFHLDPARGAALNAKQYVVDTSVIERAVAEAAEFRRQIESTTVSSIQDADEKQRLLAEAQHRTEAVVLAADLLIGASLTSNGKPKIFEDTRRGALSLVAQLLNGDDSGKQCLQARATEWIERGNPSSEPRRLLHWLLAFPEVARFDAFLGNPPFSGGQKITGYAGTDVRSHLVTWLAGGAKGSADLCAYFFLRAASLANGFGFLATNTIAQGDTREVGLDQLLDRGWAIHRAVRSRPWPGVATLEVAQVWMSKSPALAPLLDGEPVASITAHLTPPGRVTGKPIRLAANRGKAFQGSNVLGLGFTMSPDDARRLIDKDQRNADVLFPFLNGEDLNSSPSQTASRWVINFFDWSVERAQEYPDCFEIVERLVKPERARNNDRRRREVWWQFTRPALELYRAVDGLHHCLALTQTSKLQLPARVLLPAVLGHKLVVFPTDDRATEGLLSSTFHWLWALRHGSTMRADPVYTPSDVSETFARPRSLDGVADLVDSWSAHRGSIMLERQLGLTKMYNLVHDIRCVDVEIVELRRLHRELDHAVQDAYEWADLSLDHGFHAVANLIPSGSGDSRGPEIRYTVSPVTQAEILDRLLELNHDRHRAEADLGVPSGARKAKRSKSPVESEGSQGTLL